jgi:hypothetical protein
MSIACSRRTAQSLKVVPSRPFDELTPRPATSFPEFLERRFMMRLLCNWATQIAAGFDTTAFASNQAPDSILHLRSAF